MNVRRTPRYTTAQWCHRYLSVSAVAVIGALTYVLFLNDNSVIDHYEYEARIRELRHEISLNRDTLEYYRTLNDRLDTDRSTMEQIVREQYHMQRPSEDIYLTD